MSVINLLRKKAPRRIEVKVLHKLFDTLILKRNPFQIQNDPHCSYTVEDIMQVVVYASLERQTIESSCDLVNWNRGSPHPSTVRNALSRHDPENIDTLVNQHLAFSLKKLPGFAAPAARKGVALIVDFHDDPYYGEDDSPYIIKGQHKRGTLRFYRYATICLPENGLLYTLAMKSVTKQATRFGIMKYLIEHAKKLVKVKQVLADGAFYSIAVARYLDQEGITFIIRGARNSVVKQHIERHKESLRKEGAYKSIAYVMKNKRTNSRYPVKLILYRQQQEMCVLVVNKDCPLKSSECIQLYKKRFSIETPYRMKHTVKGWTSSKKPAIRSVLFGMSCLLYTFWISYRHRVSHAATTHQAGNHSQNIRYEERMSVVLTCIRLKLAPRPPQEGCIL